MLMKNNNLIAISGKIGNGKDTVGNIIQILTALPHLTDKGVESFLGREIDSPYQIKKFADKPTQIFEIITGINYHKLDRVEKEKIRPLYRKFINDTCKSDFGEDIWVNALFAEYKTKKIDIPFGSGTRTEKFEPKWIITDLRFSNEFEAVKDRGGITIKVNRNTLITDNNGDPIDPNKSYYAISTVQHPSETALDNETRWDYVIDNNGTIIDLIQKVKNILIAEKII